MMDGTEGVTEMEGALIVGTGRDAAGSLTEIVGTSVGRLTTGALKLWPLVMDGGSLTEIVGTACVVETLWKRPRGGAVVLGAGESLTEMVGIGGVTPIEGMLPVRPWPEDGVSLTEMVGMFDTDCGLLKRLLLAGRDSPTDMLGIGGCGRVDGDGSAYGSTDTGGVADTDGKAYGSAGTGGTAFAAGVVDGVEDAVFILLNGLLFAKGPFGVPGRPVLSGAGELDGPNSLKGAGDDDPDLLAGLSKGLGDAAALLAGLSNGLGAAPDLLVGLSNTLFLVGTIGSVADFSNGFGAGAGAGSGFGSAGRIDFSSFSSTIP